MYQDNLKYLVGITVFTLVYFAAAKLGLWLLLIMSHRFGSPQG
jgi:hypothetical protein